MTKRHTYITINYFMNIGMMDDGGGKKPMIQEKESMKGTTASTLEGQETKMFDRKHNTCGKDSIEHTGGKQ